MMKLFFNRKLKLVIIISVCILLTAVVFSNATVQSTNMQGTQKNNNNPTSLKNPRTIGLSFLGFFIHDWNWWGNKPNMFCIPDGNIGIGTATPDDRLDVVGIIHSTMGGFRFPDNTTQTSAAFGDGHSLDAADGTPTDAVYVDNSGNVGIGTTHPNTNLDVNGIIVGKFLLSDMDFVWESSGYVTAIMGAVEPSTNKIYVRALEMFSFIDYHHLDNQSFWRSWTDFGTPDLNSTIEDLSISLSEFQGYYSATIVVRLSSGEVYLRVLEMFSFIDYHHLDNQTFWRSWVSFGNP